MMQLKWSWPRGRQSRCSLALLALAAAASGCTLQVNSTVDAPDADPGDGVCARAVPPGGFPRGDDQGLCTLRAAVMEANATAVAERIEVPAGTYALTLPFDQGGGPLVIDRTVSIRGAGVGSTIIDAAASEYEGGAGCPQNGPERRIFTIGGGTVAIRYVTLRGGFAQHGGALRINGGEIEITDAAIMRNVAFTGGGGVFVSNGVVRIRRTSIHENCATGAFGGGLRISSGGQVWVYESLIANNRSNRAGGVFNAGALNLRSVTVSGNVAESPSAGTGGVFQGEFAVLSNVTIANNVGRGNDPASFRGGGLDSFAGATTVVRNSIIADNDGQGGPNDCSGALSGDSRFNLIGDSFGCEIPSNLNTFILDVDPLLGSLTFNGGPRQTHALQSGSPAREAGYEFPPPAVYACEPYDQRGVPRPQNARCDMGAFEAGNANLLVTSFVLVDADANEDLFTIRNGELLNLNQLPPNLSIRVQVTPSPGSIVFSFDGDNDFQIENAAPYALGGDNPAGDYNAVVFAAGEHIIRATPYAGAGASGAAGMSLELRFTVVGG